MLKYITFNVCCGHLLFIRWLQQHLLPCPFKYLTGIDCPGCGFQRSLIALVQGNLKLSWGLYPATIPLLLAIAFAITNKYYRLDNEKRTLSKVIYIGVAAIMAISYSVKIWHLFAYSKVISA